MKDGNVVVEEAQAESERAALYNYPDQEIKGGPAIIDYNVLNDKRNVLTKDTEGCVCLYDVLRAKKVSTLGNVDFQEEVAERSKKRVYVPNWFNVDLKTGVRRHIIFSGFFIPNHDFYRC